MSTKQLKSIVVAFILLLSSTHVFAQGCSDAGFCSIGNLKQEALHTDSLKHKISFGIANGIGDEKVFILTPFVNYDFIVSKQIALQAKVTSNYASGNLGSIFGLGDVYVSSVYKLKEHTLWKKNISLGVKLPLNNGNLQVASKSLPMQYQSSLGTIDIIIGVSASRKQMQVSAGYQQPISGKNGNQFLPSIWNTAESLKYNPSAHFNRKGDVLLRGIYTLFPEKRFSFKGGLLAIYHLGKDTYEDATISNVPIGLAGSEGLTLNFTLAYAYKISKKASFVLNAGTPLLVRKIRPDGLTRAFILSPELAIAF